MAALLDRSKLERAKTLKNERMEKILQAGLRAFQRFSYAEVTLDSVRKLANVPEGKPELYFGSREELFLRVLNRQFQAWASALQDTLEAAAEPLSPDRLARVLVDSVRHQPEFCHLRALLPMVLEHIIDDGAVTIFFASVNSQLNRCSEDLARRCPTLCKRDAIHLLVVFQAYASSLYQLAEPASALARLSATESAEGLDMDYESELISLASWLVSRFVSGSHTPVPSR